MAAFPQSSFMVGFYSQGILMLTTLSPLEGSPYACTEGNKLFSAIENTDICVINQGDMTSRLRQYATESATDISLTDCQSLTAYKWCVGDEPWSSDHYPISLELHRSVDPRILHRAPYKMYTLKTDWEQAISNISNNLGPLEATILNSNLDIQVKYSTFVATITSAIMEATLRKGYQTAMKAHKKHTNPINKQSQHRHSNPAPFWDEDCNRLRRGAFLCLKQYPTGDNFLTYKRTEAKTKSELKKIKQDYYRNFCKSFSYSLTTPTYGASWLSLSMPRTLLPNQTNTMHRECTLQKKQ
jgi:hypothetical protein